MEYLFTVAKDYGLFVALVVYNFWQNQQRESRYLAVIETLSVEVKERLTHIEAFMKGGRK